MMRSAPSRLGWANVMLAWAPRAAPSQVYKFAAAAPDWVAIPARGKPEAAPMIVIALRRDIVERLFDVQAERALRQLVPQAEMGLRLLAGGGDFASNQGPFYSPTFFREAMLPRLQRVTEAYHKLDCYLLYASDGNLWPVADDLFGASGIDGYYEIDDRAGMDLRKLRERFPKLTLMGGLNSYTLHRGSREDVIAETRAAMEAARECDSILVGCSNQIVAGTPRENMEAMQETIDRYR